MVVRKFNYFKFAIFIAIVIAIITGFVLLIKNFNYKKTYDYKLLNKGYSEEDIAIIKDKLSDKEMDRLLTYNYDKNNIDFFKEKYFIFNNLNSYLEYKRTNKNEDNKRIVAIINTEANIDWLDNEKNTDTSKNELMLVNRLYGLSSDYVPSDIVDVPVKYAYSGSKISNSILDKIEELIESGRENNYNFVVSGGYRSYADQEKMYNTYVNRSGRIEADKEVARPGHSEYQTGLTFDLLPYNKVLDNPTISEEYLWLKDNAYKYGFIFRLESDKEYLTQFKASTWKLRYVGESAASLIHSEDICFEEYYAYFVRGK